jgi:hypothetical protein
MQASAALSMLITAVVTFAVGVRLLLVARRTRMLPELAFGLGFLTGSLGSASAQLGQRLLWNQPGPLATAMNTGCFALLVFGNAMIYLAIWRIYRPDRTWAALLFATGSGVAVLAYGLRIASGDFATGTLESPGMLIFSINRVVLFLWASFEALRYHALLHQHPLDHPVSTALITMLVVISSASMWCAFFPPAALRRRIEARASATG